MHDTQTQIDRLIELAIVQRTELKQLVEQLPELREHLNAEIEKVFDEVEPQLRVELEDWTAKQTADQTAKLGASLEAKINDLAKALEVSTQARYSAILAEREQNFALAAEAEAKIAEHAASLPEAVKGIVDAELARFPRAGEIDQLRKEFAEPKSLNPRGKWQAGVAYNKLDLVTLNGDSYTSAKDDNRTRPSRSSADWTLVAARGTGGGGGPTSLTDLTAVPQNGELLIGNGSAFVNNTLTAGTGVTITNGAGTITIDATGAQEILTATVKNAESVAITKGQVVYLFSATGGFPSVKLAYNTSDATSAKTFGVVSDTSIAPNGTGTVTCVGVVSNLNLGTYSDGDTVYLGATPGSFTATKPYAPNHLVYVGIIERANSGNGELYVRIQNGYELDEIHDVQINAPKLAGQTLIYDQTNDLWKNAQLTGTANQITVTNADAAVTLSIPTAVTNVNSLTAQSATNLTLNGGSSGASLVLGQGASGGATLTSKGSSSVSLVSGAENMQLAAAGGAGYPSLYFNVTPSASNYTLAAGPTDLYLNATGATGPIYFRQGNTTKAMLSAAGNLLIGTTTDGGQKLQVAGTGLFTSDVTLNGATASPTLSIRGANANASPIIYLTSGFGGGSQQQWSIYTNDASAGGFLIRDNTAGSNLLTIAKSTGVVSLTSTTASTSTSTGALVVSGGVGVAGSIYGGGTAKIGSSTNYVWAGGVADGVLQSFRTSADGQLRLTRSGVRDWDFNGGTNLTIAADTATVLTLTSGGSATLSGNLTVSGGTLLNSVGAGTNAVTNTYATGPANIAQLDVKTGDGTTSSRTSRILIRTDETSPQRWDVGLAATKDFSISNSTLGAVALTINSATNNFLVGTTVDSGAKLQVGTNTTTSAGGMMFGTDCNLYRSGTRELTFLASSSPTVVIGGTANGSTTTLKLGDGVNNDQAIITSNLGNLVFKRNTTTVLTLDTSYNATFEGNITSAAGSTVTLGSEIYGRDNTTNSTAKYSRFGVSHYTNAEEPMFIFGGRSDATTNVLNIGGSSSVYNAATTTNFYAAANNTTVTGTLIASITTTGLAMASGKDISVGNAYVAGAPTATGYIVIKDSTGTSYKIPAVAL
jgi:hypothetical protein